MVRYEKKDKYEKVMDFKDYKFPEIVEKIVQKGDWGGMPAGEENPLKTPVSMVFVSMTKSESCKNGVECINNVMYLQQLCIVLRDMNDLPYNFVITNNGVIYQGRGWVEQPILPEKYTAFRDRCLYVGYMGMEESCVTDEMTDSLKDLTISGIKQNYITKKLLQFTIPI